MPAVCSSLYLERKHRLEYIESGASRKGRQTNRWSVVPGLARRRGTDDEQATACLATQRPALKEKGKTKIEGRTDGHWINKGQ